MALRFRYPFASRMRGVPDELVTALQDNFRRAERALAASEAELDRLWSSRAGVIEDFALPASDVPAGALLCYGQALTAPSPLRTKLIAAGNPYGASGGNPLLPDLRGRGRMGLDNMGGTDAGRLDLSNALGTVAGSQYVTLTSAQSGQKAVSGTTGGHSVDHGHSGTTGTVSANHTHGISGNYQANTATGGSTVRVTNAGGIGGGGGTGGSGATGTISANHTHSFSTGGVSANHTHNFSIGASDAAEGHNNLSPTILLNAIIWTGERP